MTEIQQLIAQRNEINRKINALRSETVKCGRVKVSMNPSGYKTWKLMAYVPYIHDKARGSWHAIVEEWEREDVIKQIPDIIKNLMALFNILKEEENAEQQTEREEV